MASARGAAAWEPQLVLPHVRVLQGPLLGAPSGKPSYTMLIAAPGARVPDVLPQTPSALMEALRELSTGGLLNMDGGLVQGGLATCELSLPKTGRTKKQQEKLAAAPPIKYAFEVLKARAWLLLVSTGRDPDAFCFDKLVHLWSVRGNASQEVHFDDAWLLMMIMYLYPTKPTMVATEPIPTLVEALRWIEQEEDAKHVSKLIAHWPFRMVERWLPLFVRIMQGCKTQAPVTAVPATSAVLIEAGVAHHAPAPPLRDDDDRSSFFATLGKVSGKVVPGSFMSQDLASLYTGAQVLGVVHEYPVNQQYKPVAAAYYAGCAATMFRLLRDGHRMPGDEAHRFWNSGKKDLEAMKAVIKLGSGKPAVSATAAASGSSAGRKRPAEEAKQVWDNFMRGWFTEPRDLMHMEPDE